MKRLIHVAAAASALVFAAALSACSAPSTGRASDAPSPTPSASNTETDGYMDPLSAYVTPETELSDDDFRRSEEVIAQCMKEQGFEYTVVVIESAAPTIRPHAGIPGSVLQDRDTIAKHGYRWVEARFLPPGHVSDLDSDPNYAYTNSLSPAQRAAYDRALYGKSLEQDSNTLNPEERGCNGKGADLLARTGPVPPILGDARAFLKTLSANPALAPIYDDWARCMADAGYPDEVAPGYSAALDHMITAFQDAHPSATSEDPEVKKLRDAEISQALQDWDCVHDTDFLKRRLMIYTDLEKDYIAEHKGELEEAQLWLNQ